jgi:oligopeptide/dipeptide ABC transporter ATP-binding protein
MPYEIYLRGSKMDNNDTVLQVRNLRTRFYTYQGTLDAVNGIDLDVRKNESVGLVGETGCGKSVTVLSIMRLISSPGKILSGEVLLNGENLMEKSEKEMRKVRGGKISMIFQKPMSSLNPTFKIGQQMSDVIKLHQGADKEETLEKAIKFLAAVKIPDPEKKVDQYPYELSGGMQQRVMIAMALSCNPTLLIADEPTTALDVTIQKQILNLMRELRDKFKFSMLFISHDLRTIFNVCDRVYIMYAGNIVECGGIEEIFENPKHPYFEKLKNSIPRFDIKKEILDTITGTVPSLLNPPSGCRFHPRCPYATQLCEKEIPEMYEIEKDHYVACFKAEGRVK